MTQAVVKEAPEKSGLPPTGAPPSGPPPAGRGGRGGVGPPPPSRGGRGGRGRGPPTAPVRRLPVVPVLTKPKIKLAVICKEFTMERLLLDPNKKSAFDDIKVPENLD